MSEPLPFGLTVDVIEAMAERSKQWAREHPEEHAAMVADAERRRAACPYWHGSELCMKCGTIGQATDSIERLGRVVQVSSGGISP